MTRAIHVRPATPADAARWLEMRSALWPDAPAAEHEEEVERFFAGASARTPWAVLLAEHGTGRALGFAEVSVRPCAEGCVTARVGYLEGWFVEPAARGRGVGAALVAAAEAWARAEGCTEFASDVDPSNDASAAAHRALGFTDVGLVRCFRKDL